MGVGDGRISAGSFIVVEAGSHLFLKTPDDLSQRMFCLLMSSYGRA